MGESRHREHPGAPVRHTDPRTAYTARTTLSFARVRRDLNQNRTVVQGLAFRGGRRSLGKVRTTKKTPGNRGRGRLLVQTRRISTNFRSSQNIKVFAWRTSIR